jgi:hypothetical protein
VEQFNVLFMTTIKKKRKHEQRTVYKKFPLSLLVAIVYLIPADSGVLNSKLTELFSISRVAPTSSLMLLSILVSCASFADVTPNFVLKNILPNAPCRYRIIRYKMKEEMRTIITRI